MRIYLFLTLVRVARMLSTPLFSVGSVHRYHCDFELLLELTVAVPPHIVAVAVSPWCYITPLLPLLALLPLPSSLASTITATYTTEEVNK